MKLSSIAVVLLMIILSAGFGTGCTKARQKMKVFNIKMITPENVHGVIAPDDDHIWITGNYGIIYHSSDGGKSWTEQKSGEKDSIIVDGVFLNNRIGWLVGLNGTVLHTADAGATWIKQNTGTKRHLFGICFVDERYGWAVGEWSTIIHTTDGGTTWQQQGEEADKILNNTFFIDRQTGWIIGERGKILHTTDGGATWHTQMPRSFARDSFEEELRNPAPSLYGMCFTDSRTGWACGIDGTIIMTTDGGATWNELTSNTELTLYTIFIKNGRGWVVGDKGAYLMSHDGGMTWEPQEEVILSKQPLRDVYFSSLLKGWAVGAQGTVVHTTDGGKTWEFRSGLSYAMEFFQMPEALEFKDMVME